jgi:hypothetical protein
VPQAVADFGIGTRLSLMFHLCAKRRAKGGRRTGSDRNAEYA